MAEAIESRMASDETRSALLSGELLNSISTGLTFQDETGAIVDCNEAASQLLGLTVDQLLGRTSTDPQWGAVHADGSRFPGEDHPAMVSLRTGKPCRGVVMGVDNPGRPRRWLLVDTWPVLEPGRAKGVISLFDDETPRLVREQSFRMLAAVNQLVINSTTDGEFLQQVSDLLVKVGGFALAGFIVQSDIDELGVSGLHMAGCTDYVNEDTFKQFGSTAIECGPVASAYRTMEMQVVNGIAEAPAFQPWRDRALEFGIESVVAIPMMLAEKKAVMAVCGHHPFAFDDVTVESLIEIARQAEFGAAHVRSMSQLEVALDGTLSALSRMTETRDPYTAGHQSRVGLLSESIARHLGLDADLVRLIRQAGDVHDIGKIAVPAEILTRPGRLSDVELELVKQHPHVGADILTKATLPWPVADVALQHHERMDGSGYPNGLVGDQIILPARIVAVADVIEAMTAHRPYRPARGIERALAQVKAGSGSLFDVDVVDACVAVIEAGFAFGLNW